jgi:hypothetical protein
MPELLGGRCNQNDRALASLDLRAKIATSRNSWGIAELTAAFSL